LHSDGLQQRVEELEKQKDDYKAKNKLLQEVSQINIIIFSNKFKFKFIQFYF
jgi:hypothetical protein